MLQRFIFLAAPMIFSLSPAIISIIQPRFIHVCGIKSRSFPRDGMFEFRMATSSETDAADECNNNNNK